MFSKQVWHDRKHQVEVFRNQEGEVIGTIVSFRKGICLINPRPDVLIALYQEAKIRRISSVNAIVLTESRPEFVRGLCTFLGYSRELKRRKVLDVRVVVENPRATSFINSCCMQIMKSGSKFDLDLGHLSGDAEHHIGDGAIRVRRTVAGPEQTSMPFVEIQTGERTIHYFDERFREQEIVSADGVEPDVAVRAAQIPQYRQVIERDFFRVAR